MLESKAGTVNELNFGRQLRLFRQQTFDPQSKKALSQQKLGELLGIEMKDFGFSGAAISEWERNKSRIHASNRFVLISLVRVLKQYGGIETISDANLLLESGGYSALNPVERRSIFPEELPAASSTTEDDPPPNSEGQDRLTSSKEETNSKKTESTTPPKPKRLFFIPADEFQQILEEASQGPPPAWPKIVTMLFHTITARISPVHVLRGIFWVWIWGLAYWLISPSLKLFHVGEQDLANTLRMYTAGAFLIPPLTGLMAGTNKNVFWKEQNLPRPLVLHLYAHQGAYIGFHVGYFLVFLFSYVQVLFGIPPAALVEGLKIAVPLFVGTIGAQMIPYNLWRAYKRLDLKDGWIFFVFVLLGPIWALFLFKFNEILLSPFMGAIIILLAITFIAWQASKKRML